MTYAHSKESRVLVDDRNFSPWVKTVTSTGKVNLADATSLADADRTWIPGQKEATFALTGMSNADTTPASLDYYEWLQSIDVATPPLALVSDAPHGFAIGAPVFASAARVTTWTPQTPFNGIVMLNPSFVSEDAWRAGVSLHDIAVSENATANGTGADGAAASATGWNAYLHVISNTRNGNSTMKIQHSTDNITYVDLPGAGFTAVGINATGKQRLAGAALAAVNRYARGVWTLAGSSGAIVFALVLVRL